VIVEARYVQDVVTLLSDFIPRTWMMCCVSARTSWAMPTDFTQWVQHVIILSP